MGKTHFGKKLIFVFLAFFLSVTLLEFGLRIAFFIKDSLDKKRESRFDLFQEEEKALKRATGINEPWIGEVLDETEKTRDMEFQPFTVWRSKEFHGKYVNLSPAGIRKTWNINQKINDVKKVYCFGGSTLWGFYVRDDYTIASLLSKELYNNGYKNYYVENFGEKAYSSTQGLMQLILLLKEGDVPDYVIFYDGANDVYIASEEDGEPGTIINLKELRLKASKKEMSDIQMFTKGLGKYIEHTSGIRRVIKLLRNKKRLAKSSENKNGILESNTRLVNVSEEAINKYLENVVFLEKLAKTYGFKVKCFWQPVLYYARPEALSLEQESYKRHKVFAKLYEKAYSLIASRKDLPKDFINLSDIFYSLKEPVYIDFCHLSEKGNEIIVKEMFNRIKVDLQ
jgi:lysophospholipase L1-like esterase